MTAEHSPAGLSALATRDQEAITRTLTSLLAGFRERDADKLTDVYSDDANWVNAFGSVKQGRQEILTYLRGLFADANFNAGTLKAPPRAASASSPMTLSSCRPTSSSKDRNCSTAVSSTSATTAPCTSSSAKATAHGPLSRKFTWTPIAASHTPVTHNSVRD